MFDTLTEAHEAALTDRQRAVLAVVRDHLAAHGYPPTVREIGTRLGLASSSTVHSHLAALERAGLLIRDPSKPRALRVAAAPQLLDAQPDSTTGDDGHDTVDQPSADPDVYVAGSISLPLLGEVAAGAPLLAEEHCEQHLAVPELLTRSGESFTLRIRGESMIDAGILDGDYVVVRRQATATDGEIVIALIDDEATCKYFYRYDGRITLVPANETMQPMVPPSCTILGIVTGIFRSI